MADGVRDSKALPEIKIVPFLADVGERDISDLERELDQELAQDE